MVKKERRTEERGKRKAERKTRREANDEILKTKVSSQVKSKAKSKSRQKTPARNPFANHPNDSTVNAAMPKRKPSVWRSWAESAALQVVHFIPIVSQWTTSKSN